MRFKDEKKPQQGAGVVAGDGPLGLPRGTVVRDPGYRLVQRSAAGLERRRDGQRTRPGFGQRPALAARRPARPGHRRGRPALSRRPRAEPLAARRRPRRFSRPARQRFCDRRARLVFRVVQRPVRRACRQPVRHRHRRFRDAARAHRDRRFRPGAARLFQGRSVHRLGGRQLLGAARAVHRLPGEQGALRRFSDRGRTLVDQRDLRTHRQRARLGAQLSGRRRALRRRLEYAVSGAGMRGRDDHPRHDDGAARRTQRRPARPGAAARRCAAAYHHSAFRRRPRPDPAFRPRRNRQPVPRIRFRDRADALVLRCARRLDRAALRLYADRLHDHARRRSRRRAEPRRGGADAARRPPPDLSDDHAAAAQAGAGQRLPGRLHREHRRLRQSCGRRRPVLGAVDRHLLRHRRRPVRPGARRFAGVDPDGLRAGRLRAAARAARQTELYHGDRQGRRWDRHGAARLGAAACSTRWSTRGWRSP